MLQIGKYTAPQDGRPAIIQREFYGQGYIFKDEAAFLSHPDQVCYVPELSDTPYTHNDLLALCDGQEKLAQCCFDCLNWQSPTTWVDEQFIFGEWVRCEECHRVYDAEEHSSCPHCGNEQDGDSSEQWVLCAGPTHGNARRGRQDERLPGIRAVCKTGICPVSPLRLGRSDGERQAAE